LGVAADASPDVVLSGAGAPAGAAATAASTAIEVRDLRKTFRIPTERVTRPKERLTSPLARAQYRDLHALRDVSFDIRRGEFFGIVGRNGSGKSTLLKIMASIYCADGGSVRMAGNVAPFIELGVGFDMELNARENVVLNAVMMGLTPKEARGRLDAVIEFAELEEFVDMKLKNYSSGMLVRLAFSVMVQADTDILLIDEVLAVGDAAFQQKCADVFHNMRDEGKTVVLVTHNMAAVEEYCHRAMLISDGEIVEMGDPNEVARHYVRLNFEGTPRGGGAARDATTGDVGLVDVWLEGADGRRIENLEQGEEIRIRSVLDVRGDVPDPLFGFIVENADGVNVHEFACGLPDGKRGWLRAGQRVNVSVTAKNDLSPGRFQLHHGVVRNRNRFDNALLVPNALGFVVYGDQESTGAVITEHEMQVDLQPGEST
jgi:ABC-type polysaccharide/polyol phosphate transport system ATPase subunit